MLRVPRGVVLVHAPESKAFAQVHELTTRCSDRRQIGGPQGVCVRGSARTATSLSRPGLLGAGRTRWSVWKRRAALGVSGEHDLFGGVVPHAFVATKVITHPLVDAAAQRPEGWEPRFGERVAPVVLPGFSVFAHEDARKAGQPAAGEGERADQARVRDRRPRPDRRRRCDARWTAAWRRRVRRRWRRTAWCSRRTCARRSPTAWAR